MTDHKAHISGETLVTPRAAAIAGILFGVLFAISFSLIRDVTPELRGDTGEWMTVDSGNLSLAIGLLPFAGIAFLWFMAVVRDRLGHLEDQFFSTLFFGSGLLYLAMIFAASALFAGLMHMSKTHPELVANSGAYTVTRAIIYTIIHEYAIRMSGMFMIVMGTIWFRTTIMPRWLALLTFLLALVLLFSIEFSEWAMMVFPVWVFLISVYILVLDFRRRDGAAAAEDGMTLED